MAFAASAVGAAAALTGVFAWRAADSSSATPTDAPSEQSGSTVSPDASDSPSSDLFGDEDSGLVFPAPPDDEFTFEPPGAFEGANGGELFSDGGPATPAQPAP